MMRKNYKSRDRVGETLHGRIVRYEERGRPVPYGPSQRKKTSGSKYLGKHR